MIARIRKNNKKKKTKLLSARASTLGQSGSPHPRPVPSLQGREASAEDPGVGPEFRNSVQKYVHDCNTDALFSAD